MNNYNFEIINSIFKSFIEDQFSTLFLNKI